MGKNKTENNSKMAGKAQYKEKVSSTPYDDVFRTMLNDCSRFILPILNEVFGEDYDGTEEIVFANDYHFKNMQDGEEEKIITDSSFKVIKGIIEKKYHLECQSTIDNSMIIRFFEYDSQIALDDAVIKVTGQKRDDTLSGKERGGEIIERDEKIGGTLIVTFPHSAVLFLRSNKNTADAMQIRFVTPVGELEYKIPVVKMQKYSLEEIWKKEFYFLIPFYIFTHEANFAKYNEDDKALKELTDEFSYIRRHLSELAESGKITEFENRTIVELSKKVIDNIARKYEKITEGVDRIMGGKVIETEAKRILNRGIAIGEANGAERGRSEGLKNQISKKLAKGKNIPQIADEVEESEERVIELIKEIEAEQA